MLKRALFLFCFLAHCTLAHAVPITAKVVGTDGKPIAKAQVFVFTSLNSYPPPAPLTFETDQDGVFKADLNLTTNPPNSYGIVTVYVPGLALSGGLLKQGQNIIKMEAPAEAHGSVKDGTGKPIADAVVTLIAAFKNMNNLDGLAAIVPEQLKSQFSVKSGADGNWTLGGVPAAYHGMVLLNDPRYIHAFAEVTPGGTPTTLTAQVGASVTGKVVHEDGTPAAGIKVSAVGGSGGPFGANDTTDANGIYHLTGLTPGPVIVVAADPSGQWVTLPVSDIKAKSGETVQAPNHTLIQGSFITGVVTDKATRAPLSNVAVWAGAESQLAVGGIEPVRSDKEGHYKIRVTPGKNTVSLLEQPKGYLPLAKPLEVEVGKGETKELPIELNAGLTVAGIALDAQGKPAADVEIKATIKDPNQNGEWIQPVTTKTDATGKWALDGLRKGQWSLSTSGAWNVVGPLEISVPATDAQKLTLRKVNLLTLKGRVVTKDHKPLGAVTIKAHVEVPDGQNSTQLDEQDAATDATGQFTLKDLRPDVKVSFTPDAAGYKFLAGGKVTLQGQGFEVQDIVLLPLAAKVTGVVADAEGKPVAGAKVMSPDGDPKLQVTTDADGKFTLTSLPAGDVMVIAGYKGAVGEARDVNGKAPVSLKLQPVQPVPPSDIQRAYSLLEELWATTEGTQTYRNNIPVTLAAYDPDLAVKLASRKDGTINDSILSQIIAVVAKTDAARALEWAVPKVTQIKDGYSSYTAKSSLAFALADLKPDVAKGFYNEAKAFDKDQTAQNPKEYQGISSRATLLSRIAAKLHLKNEANQFAQVAINAINATPAAERTWMMGPVLALNPDGDGKAIAFNPDLGGKLLADLSAEPRKQVISNAITSSISYGDLLTARSLLDNLLEIEKQNTNGGIYSGSAKQSLVEALGKRDPAAALELAHNDSTRDTYNRAITLALAAQYQPKDVALQVLREAADAAAAYPSLDANSRVAAIAYGIDPKIGAEIFETAHTRLEAEKAQRESSDIYGGQNTSIADFAYYYSRLDPAESRLLLEAEFTRQKQIPRTTDNRWQYSNNLTNLIAAMAAVDIDRAMELTYLLPPPDKDDQWNNPQTEGQRLIAQYVLLSDAERRSKSFRDWDKSNGWQ